MFRYYTTGQSGITLYRKVETSTDEQGVEYEERNMENKARKVLENGRIYIIFNGVKYNLLGEIENKL